mgnify:CR=1 FL=1
MDLEDVTYFLWGLSRVTFWAAIGSLLGTAIILTPWPLKTVPILLFVSLTLMLAARVTYAWRLYR